MEICGSCCCKGVTFKGTSHCPCPYIFCYCSICRKLAGGGGAFSQIVADAACFKVEGFEHVGIFLPSVDKPDGSKEQGVYWRYFCKRCGSHLWSWDPTVPNVMLPVAGAVDTPLPKPPERVHIYVPSKADWVEVPQGANDVHLGDEYPRESEEDFHRRHHMYLQ